MNAIEAREKSEKSRKEIERQKQEAKRLEDEAQEKSRLACIANALEIKLPEVFKQIEDRVVEGLNKTSYAIFNSYGAYAIADHLKTLGYKTSVTFVSGKEDLLEGYGYPDTWHVEISW